MRIIARNLNRLLLVAILLIATGKFMAPNTFPASARVSIATPDVSVIPDTKSTAHGVLIPGMKDVQANAIALPAMGLLSYRICYLMILFLGFLVMIKSKMKKNINNSNFIKNDIFFNT